MAGLLSGALLSALQNPPGVNTWDWEAGEPAPAAIRTPWLSGAWHYDEFGRVVPNNPNNPMAPWNRPGSTMTMDEYYESMPANSGLFAGGIKPPVLAGGIGNNTFQARLPVETPGAPFVGQGGYGRRRSPLEDALRRLQGGM